MDRAIHRPIEIPFSSILLAETPARSPGRHRALAWLLAATGAVSVALLLVAMQADTRSTHAFQDVNLSGSLRYRSLWIYGATQNSAAHTAEDTRWPAQIAAMAGIRAHLRSRYPAAVGATDPAWNSFAGTLRRTGHIDWQTANAMRLAADMQTHQIEAEAASQNAAASALLRLGIAGMLCALAASGLLLRGLRVTETEMQQSLTRLQESRDLFLQSINAVQEGYLVQDRDGIILLCNAGAEHLLGVSAEDVIGQPAERPGWRLLRETGEELSRAEYPSRQALHTAQPQEPVVVGIARPDADLVWLAMKAAPVFHAGQTVPYAAVLTFTDITAKKNFKEEKKQIERQLQVEREFQQAVLESLQSGIVACDAAGTLTLFNRAAREFHGLPEESLPPEEWADHFDLYQADGITPLPTTDIPLFRAFQGEIVRESEMVIAPRGYPSRTLIASGQAIYSSTGEKLGAVAAMHDITARRRIERELSRLAAIVESSEEAILAMTLDGTLVSWNAGAERLYGYAESEVIGQHASILVPEGELSSVETVIPRLMRGESVEPVEVVRRRRDGTPLDVALTFSPIHDTAGNVIGLSCIARDITARRQAEDALRESEARLRYLADAAFEGIAVSRDGVVLDANPAFLSLYGYGTREQVIGLTAEALVVPEASALVRQKVAAEAEDIYEAKCLRRDGTTFFAEVRGRKILWDGLPARATAVRDITERKVIEEALQESQRFAHSIAENSASLIFVLDLETGSIIHSNRNVSEFFGYTLDEMTALGGELIPTVVHPDDIPSLLKSLGELQNLEDGLVSEFEYRVRHFTGEWRWVWSRNVIFKRRPDGTPWQILGNALDITERRQVAEALRHSEEALRALMSSAPIILYAADLDGTITLSEGTGLAALGLAPGETVGRSIFEFNADPLSEARTRRALAGEAASYEVKYGAICLHVELRPQYDAAGAVSGIIGVCFDITERAQSEERFRVLFEQSSNAHVLFDDSGIFDCNPATLAMMRCADKAQLLGIHPALLSPPCQPDGPASGEKGEEMCALARKNGTHHFEWTRRTVDGIDFPVEVALTEVMLNERPVLLSVWHDLTERKRAEQQIKDYTVILEFQKSQLETANHDLEALATTDGLTGLKNHRRFQEKLAEEHARAVRYHQPLSLLLLDVDQFKRYNDSFGHPAGDAVLIGVAAILESTARDTDVAARYGGEEFVVILPQTDEAGALVIAERVRAAIADEHWQNRPITVSIGICTLSLDTPTPGTMIGCADKALYQSKKTGRNRVTHGNPAAPLINLPDPLIGPSPRPARAKRLRAAPELLPGSVAEQTETQS